MNLNKLNILLADDDEDDCVFFMNALKEISPESKLMILKDGDQLMNFLHNNVSQLPDVLFLDINMPRKNGIECLSEIRKNKELKHLPIVMFSTSNSWDTINRLFRTGAHVYIHKPSDFTQLKEVIYHAIPLAAEKIYSINPLKYILNAANNDRPK